MIFVAEPNTWRGGRETLTIMWTISQCKDDSHLTHWYVGASSFSQTERKLL